MSHNEIKIKSVQIKENSNDQAIIDWSLSITKLI